MPSRSDYLAALDANPGLNAEKMQTDVKAPTLAAAETMLRKLASGGFVRIESTSPRTYFLTEKGKTELGLADSNDRLPALGERGKRLRSLLERVRARAETNGETDLEQPSGDETRTEIQMCPGVPELLAFERAVSDLPRRELQKVKQCLCDRIADESITEKVSRLAEAEAELCEEKSWWADKSEVERLETEIAELKRELGLPEVEVQSEG
jgi:DNA-binding PadR family transcriptional regulator